MSQTLHGTAVYPYIGVVLGGQCRHICHTWSVWVLVASWTFADEKAEFLHHWKIEGSGVVKDGGFRPAMMDNGCQLVDNGCQPPPCGCSWGDG